MWNSPSSPSRAGRRYLIQDIRALIHPLDQLTDSTRWMSITDVVSEEILRTMDPEELIYGIYEVLQALLTDSPTPEDGHPGYQEAIIAELLHQTYQFVVQEIENPESGTHARQAAWDSYSRLCVQMDERGTGGFALLDHLGLDLNDPNIHESPKISAEIWEQILVGGSGIWSEFLWDDDWRMDHLMDLPGSVTKPVTETTGIDLSVVHRLPHSPSKAEQRMAEYFIRYVIWADEVFDEKQRGSSK